MSESPVKFIMPTSPQPAPDLEWAKKHIRGFAERKQAVDEKHADEERYRQNPGYVPPMKVAT